jgi:hypothetical protein
MIFHRHHWSLAACIVASACKDGGAPVIQDPGDQTAVVGQQLTIDILATDPEGDDLDYRFEANGVPDLSTTTSVTIAPDGHGVFTFTPLASQLGSHLFDFIVSDGKHDSKLTININVVGAGGNGTLPIFRKPLGNGTVLDLEQAECVEFDVQIEDQDSTQVTLDQLPPIIQDAELTSDPSGLNGRWTWCPNREQLEAADRYDLTLSAQDAPENQATLKDYVIVLRRRSGADCPGEAPTIEHTPADATGLLDIPIQAHVTDDKGIKNAPILLYAYADPGDPIDYTKLTVVTMTLSSGDMQDGTWSGYITNPTTEMGEGSEADIWYVVSVNDNDDAEGDCDHLTDSPADGTHEIHVVNDGTGSAGVCGACSFDVQCGSFSNLCLAQEGGNFCGVGCTSDEECDAGFLCSPTEVQSIEGAAAQQCVPTSGTCIGGGDGGTCEEDDAEDNDAIDEAMTLVSLMAGEMYTAALCNDTNDWFRFDLDGQGAVTATLAGPSDVDMDLVFTDAEGVLIDASAGLQSDETLTTSCLDGGTYYLRIYAPNSTVKGEYTFGVEVDSECGGGGGTGDCCTDTNMPGCEDADITACVCAIDDFCCSNEWDNLCAGKAQSECGLDCGGGTGHDCCTAGDAGCDDATVQACVCAADSFCCETSWDATCVTKVGSQLCASACDPDDSDGACCEAHPDDTGCEVNAVETCVCAMDEVCCSQGWDQTCVNEIAEFDCGSCP